MKQYLVGDKGIDRDRHVGEKGRKTELHALPQGREHVPCRFCKMDLIIFAGVECDPDDKQKNMGDEVGQSTADHTHSHTDDKHPVKEEIAECVDQCGIKGHFGIARRDIKTSEDPVDQDQRDIPDADRKKSLDIGEKDLCPAEKDDDWIHEDLAQHGDDTAEDRGQNDGRGKDPAGIFRFTFAHFCRTQDRSTVEKLNNGHEEHKDRRGDAEGGQGIGADKA